MEELAGNAAAVPPLSLLLAGPVCTVFLSTFPGFSYGFRVVFPVGDFRGRSRGGGGGGGGVGKKFCAAVSHDTSRATPCELVTYVQLPTAQDFSLSRADAYRDFCWS